MSRAVQHADIARLQAEADAAFIGIRRVRERAAAFCKANGLNSVAEMRAYCMRLARSFGKLDFDQWCRRMRQQTVDIIVRQDGPASKALANLRDAGVIDDDNRLISLERRESARAARAAAKAERDREAA